MLTAIFWGGLAAASLLVGFILARRAFQTHGGRCDGIRRWSPDQRHCL